MIVMQVAKEMALRCQRLKGTLRIESSFTFWKPPL